MRTRQEILLYTYRKRKLHRLIQHNEKRWDTAACGKVEQITSTHSPGKNQVNPYHHHIIRNW